MSAGRLTLAVDGLPGVTDWMLVVTPSTVKVMVPDGSVVPIDEGEMVAVTGKVAPRAGVVVDGVTTSVLGVRATVMLTVVETEPLKLLSPL